VILSSARGTASSPGDAAPRTTQVAPRPFEPALPLGLLADGELAEIVGVVSAGAEHASCAARAEDMGLRIGKQVLMLNNGAGPVLVKVDESRIAVDRRVAMKIKVRRS
jgi:ferrous iron transport protein A